MSEPTWMDEYEPPPYWPGRTCEHCKHWSKNVGWMHPVMGFVCGGDGGKCFEIERHIEICHTGSCEGDGEGVTMQEGASCWLWGPAR